MPSRRFAAGFLRFLARLRELRMVSVSVVLALVVTGLAALPMSAAEGSTATASTGSSRARAASDAPAGDPSAEAAALTKAASSGKSVEVPSENTETTTTYANPDGTFTDKVAQSPIRTEDADGSLVPIDTSLSKDAGRLAPEATETDSSFSATGSGQLATLDTEGSTSLSMGYGDDLGAPSVAGSTADYPVQGADPTQVSVSASSSGFSAHVVLAAAPSEDAGAAPTYSFPLHLNGLRASLENGQLEFRDQAGTVVAYSAPLQMWDSQATAAGDPTNVSAVDASLVDGPDGQQTLELRPSASFLDDPTTQYPVTIDPDVSSVGEINDTFVYSTNPDTYYGDSYRSRVGSPDGTGKQRTLERFAIDKYMGKNIVSANLAMYEYQATSCANGSFSAYPSMPVFKSVRDATTWNNQPTAIFGGVWRTKVDNTASTICNGATRNFDVTPMLNGYTTEALSSIGAGTGSANDDTAQHVATIELWATNETAANQEQDFCSFEGTSAASSTNPCKVASRVPTLSLTYTADLGDQKSYSTTDHDLNDRTKLKINNDNGNALVQANDVQIHSLGTPLNLSRYYNAQASESDQAMNPKLALSMGPKWGLSVGPDVRITQSANNPNGFDYRDPTGKFYAGFTRKSTTTSTDPNADYYHFTSPKGGIDSELVQGTDGSFTLTAHSSQQQMTFVQEDASSKEWVLTSVLDRSGQGLTINYPSGSNHMSSIADASGHTVSITWTGNLITQITDANATPTRTWQYGYTNGQLTAYTDPAGKITDYSWTTGTNPVVATIQDPANASAARPMVTLTSTAGQVVKVEYAFDAAGDTVGYNFQHDPAVSSRCNDGDASFDSSTTVTSFDASKGPVTYCFRERGDSGSQKAHRVVDGNGNKQSATFTIDDQASTFNGAGGTASGTTVATYGASPTQDQLTGVTDPMDGSGSAHSTTLNYTNSTSKGHDYLPTTVVDSDGSCKSYTYDNEYGSGHAAKDGLLTDTYLTPTSACTTTNGKHYHEDFNFDGTVAWSDTPVATSGNAADRTIYSYFSSKAQGNNGLVSSVQKPGGVCSSDSTRKLCTSYTYDGLGRVKTVTDGRGNVTSYDYDVFDRTLAVHVNGDISCNTGGGNCIKYTYDADGNVTGRLDRDSTNFTYDRLNRQIKVDGANGTTTNYKYNDDGKMTELDVLLPGDSTKTWTYAYDSGDQPKSVTGPGGSASTIMLNHDTDNKPSYVKFPTTNPVVETRDYTNAKRPKSITVAYAAGGSDVLPDWTYNYKNSGGNDSNQQQNATVKGAAAGTGINQSVDYQYTGLGQLSTANSDTGNDYTYAYSDAGDLVSEKKADANGNNASTTNYGFDKAGQLCWQGTTDGPDVTSGCGATPNGDATLSQDAAGNSLGTAATPFTYNAFNQAATIGPRSQAYNDQGNDLRNQTGDITTTTAPAGGAQLTNTNIGVVARRTAAGITYYTRDPSGRILAEDGPNTATGTNPDPDTFYYLTDYHGSVVGLLDTAGSLAAWYRYSPYGDAQIINGTSATAGAANPWRYIGGYSDIEGDGYTQLQARYYDNHGHFTQSDPKQGSFSDPLTMLAFGYTAGDPANKADPSGRSFSDIVDGIGDVASTLDAQKFIGDVAQGDFSGAFADGLGTIAGDGFEVACGLSALALVATGPGEAVAQVGCLAGGAAIGEAVSRTTEANLE